MREPTYMINFTRLTSLWHTGVSTAASSSALLTATMGTVGGCWALLLPCCLGGDDGATCGAGMSSRCSGEPCAPLSPRCVWCRMVEAFGPPATPVAPANSHQKNARRRQFLRSEATVAEWSNFGCVKAGDR